MMELLSGPYIVARAANTRPTYPYSVSRAFWDDELGIGSLGAAATVSDSFGREGNYFVAQLDGTCGTRGSVPPAMILVDLSGEYEWNYYDLGYNPAAGTPFGYLYGFDKQSGVYANTPIAIGPGILGITYAPPLMRTADRLISVLGTTITNRAIDGSDTEWISECSLTLGAGDATNDFFTIPSVSRTKDPGVVCLIYPSGGVLFYDVIGKKQVVKPWTPYIGRNDGAWYSVKFDIFISYTVSNGDWYVSVWANTVRPATLGNPEPATPAVSGRVSQVRARLLGDRGESCEGELVEWSITNGDGSLTATQSKTDANGYAYIGYVAPVTKGAAPTIHATVEF